MYWKSVYDFRIPGMFGPEELLFYKTVITKNHNVSDQQLLIIE